MFFDRPEPGTRTALVLIRIGKYPADESEVVELYELSASAGLIVELHQNYRQTQINTATCIGTGKVNELYEQLTEHKIQLLVIDYELSASQQRNLEKALKVRVMTRTELILQLFESRAHTREGKLQVELATLSHAQTRLVKGWSHLDRQKGGIGLRGAGETQLAIDRTLIQKRIRITKERIKKVKEQRAVQRQRRRRNKVPTVALVGYTNAGKSTLFNALTKSKVYTDDRLFATLDATVRKLDLPTSENILLSDTVGFIRDLPLELVAAFRSTLEEVTLADLLVHVIDVSQPDQTETIHSVSETLKEIGVDDTPNITVFNKVDTLTTAENYPKDGIAVSAVHGTGLDTLKNAILKGIQGIPQPYTAELQPQDGRIRSMLYSMHAVKKESFQEDGGITMQLNLAPKQAADISEKYGLFLQG